MKSETLIKRLSEFALPANAKDYFDYAKALGAKRLREIELIVAQEVWVYENA